MSSTYSRTNWTARGADVAARDTYASVKYALRHLVERGDIEVFLQGSYANHTNIRADSDVDIVVMSTKSFYANPEGLTQAGRMEWDRLPSSTYTVWDLRNDINQALTAHYGSDRVHPKDKCIRIDKAPGYVDADVVPAFQYRHFRNALSVNHFIEGVKIFPLSGGSIINFPKEHIKNGSIKNQNCSEHYKPTVRQFKRLRNQAVAEFKLESAEAPGYLLECMVFNVPTSYFISSDYDRLLGVLAWLKHANKSDFLACDQVHHLFVNDPGKYDVNEAQRVLDALWETL